MYIVRTTRRLGAWWNNWDDFKRTILYTTPPSAQDMANANPPPSNLLWPGITDTLAFGIPAPALPSAPAATKTLTPEQMASNAAASSYFKTHPYGPLTSLLQAFGAGSSQPDTAAAAAAPTYQAPGVQIAPDSATSVSLTAVGLAGGFGLLLLAAAKSR